MTDQRPGACYPAGPIIRVVAETGSTNADLLGFARAGAVEGSWLRAERQTAGRGRQGRAWDSPPGNLYASTLVRLRPDDPSAASLALVAAVALHEVVAASLPPSTPVRLKWPNDLMVEGAKLSGILLERAGDAVVIGMGVNVLRHPHMPERPTISLAAAGAEIGPADLMAALVGVVARWVERWRREGMDDVRAAWLARAHDIGTPLSVHLPDGTRAEGVFDGLDRDGALVLRLASGERRVMHVADVFLL